MRKRDRPVIGKYRLRVLALAVLVLLAAFAADALAKSTNPHEAEFQTFRKDFLAAAAANDKSRLADLIAFPVEYWSIEKNHNVDEGAIASREEFLKRYDEVFTPWMRAHLAKAKAESLDNGRYLISWVDGNSEFTFMTEYLDTIGWRVRSYGIGAR
jgi:hypothetical protein